ncbi:aminoacyl-tRNA hydrolase [Patescibacteria group bacterium]
MKLFIGLGNPGIKYQNTRHNVGYLVVDKLLLRKVPAGFVIRKSSVFMNESGLFVDKLVKQYNVKGTDLWVIHDDLDLLIGTYKIQFGKGPKDHKGLASIDEKIGNNDYWHVRVGVDNRSEDERTLGEEYVLQDFEKEEKVILDKVVNNICKKLVTL